MDAPPFSIEVDAYPIDWPVTLDSAALPPINLLVNAADRIRMKLIPFGAATLHSSVHGCKLEYWCICLGL